jgi:hypothetical protein
LGLAQPEDGAGIQLKTLRDNSVKEANMVVYLEAYYAGQPFEDFSNKLAWSYIKLQLDGAWKEVPYYRREEIAVSKPNATDWGLRQVSYCC